MAGETTQRVLRLSFAYSAGSGTRSERAVEPMRMVTTGDRWYLMGWDLDRATGGPPGSTG